MSAELAEQDITRITRIAQQLIGDLSRVPGLNLPADAEPQALQLIFDAFETVGLMAMEVRRRYDEALVAPLYAKHGKMCSDPSCRIDHYSP